MMRTIERSGLARHDDRAGGRPSDARRRARLLVTSSAAVLSHDGVYRYSLTRRWDAGPVVRWIMLNPSIADHRVDDPTIRRCMAFSRRWGCAGIVVHNLFALRATDPRELRQHPNPIGPDNDAHLRGDHHGDEVALTVCAWGANTAVVGRARVVEDLLGQAGVRPHVLGLTAAGFPRHPLYVRADTPPTELAPERRVHARHLTGHPSHQALHDTPGTGWTRPGAGERDTYPDSGARP
jgi:hypothetical protein